MIILLAGIGALAYFTNKNYSKQAEKEMTSMSQLDTGILVMEELHLKM